MNKRDPAKNVRAKENKKKRADLKARARMAERKRLGLEDGEEEALLAGPLRRYMSFALDLVLILFMYLFCLLVSIILMPNREYMNILFPIAVVLMGIIYTIPKNKIEGRTFGKRKLNTEIIRIDGNGYLTWGQAIIRWFVQFGIPFVFVPLLSLIYEDFAAIITLVGIAIFGLVMLPAALTRHRQGIHDMLAGSVVVRVFPEKRKFFQK